MRLAVSRITVFAVYVLVEGFIILLCLDPIARDALYGIATVWLRQNPPRHVQGTSTTRALEVPYGIEKQARPRHVHGMSTAPENRLRPKKMYSRNTFF